MPDITASILGWGGTARRRGFVLHKPHVSVEDVSLKAVVRAFRRLYESTVGASNYPVLCNDQSGSGLLAGAAAAGTAAVTDVELEARNIKAGILEIVS